MIGRLIGALAGRQAAKHSAAIGGTGGAILGSLAVPLIARLSIPTLVIVGAGGYLAKRAYDKKHAADGARTGTAANPATATATQA